MVIPKKRVVSTASAVQVLGENMPDSMKGKGKAVNFDEGEEKELKIMSPWEKGKENEFEYVARHPPSQPYHTQTDMQISPRRPVGLATSSVPSPLRPLAGSASGSAQDLLRSLVRDVMFEHHQETKAELMGLHLDLIRAGRSWKQELREVMDEYMSDLRELREENVRLRKENEMLRRGY
jgi:protein NEDD1